MTEQERLAERLSRYKQAMAEKGISDAVSLAKATYPENLTRSARLEGRLGAVLRGEKMLSTEICLETRAVLEKDPAWLWVELTPVEKMRMLRLQKIYPDAAQYALVPKKKKEKVSNEGQQVPLSQENSRTLRRVEAKKRVLNLKAGMARQQPPLKTKGLASAIASFFRLTGEEQAVIKGKLSSILHKEVFLCDPLLTQAATVLGMDPSVLRGGPPHPEWDFPQALQPIPVTNKVALQSAATIPVANACSLRSAIVSLTDEQLRQVVNVDALMKVVPLEQLIRALLG